MLANSIWKSSAPSADKKAFVVQPHRWIVERSFAWLTKCRRLVKDYERLIAHSAAFIRLVFINLMFLVISR